MLSLPSSPRTPGQPTLDLASPASNGLGAAWQIAILQISQVVCSNSGLKSICRKGHSAPPRRAGGTSRARPLPPASNQGGWVGFVMTIGHHRKSIPNPAHPRPRPLSCGASHGRHSQRRSCSNGASIIGVYDIIGWAGQWPQPFRFPVCILRRYTTIGRWPRERGCKGGSRRVGSIPCATTISRSAWCYIIATCRSPAQISFVPPGPAHQLRFPSFPPLGVVIVASSDSRQPSRVPSSPFPLLTCLREGHPRLSRWIRRRKLVSPAAIPDRRSHLKKALTLPSSAG